ncbi:MAG: hypothetical protein WC412_05110 [Candidatus Omnitrophota bacterium]|jgi:hypothetical protein
MFKKVIKIFILFLMSAILLTTVFRNQIIRFNLEGFVRKNFKIDCKIQRVNLWFDSFSIKGLKLSSKDFDATAKNILIRFKFQKGAPIYLSEFALSDLVLKVKSLEGLTQSISNKKTAPAALPANFRPIKFNLQNINIDLKSKTFDASSNFSIIAEVGSDKLLLEDANVSNFEIHSQDFEITRLGLRKFRKGLYLISTPSVRAKDKKFNNFSIPVKVNVNQIIFPKAKNAFFGPEGYLSAKIDFSKYNKFCLIANFSGVSFEKIVDVFASEDAAFKGSFDGSLRACVSGLGIETVEAGFYNKGNGFINIKKESSLAFLKSYLDGPSYNALIDNFKNYEYNVGVVSAKNEADALKLGLDFTSEAMGRRNITINFHDVK